MSNTYILVAGDARIDNLITAAQGTEITAIVIGTREVADAVATSGVAKVTWLGDPDNAALESYAGAVAEIVSSCQPALVLASTRPTDRVLAGAVAARLAAPVYTMVTTVAVAEGVTEITRSVFGGIAQETTKVVGPAVVVMDGGALGAGGLAPITDEQVSLNPAITVVETRPVDRAQVDLSKAHRIVAVGRGLKAQSDVTMVDSLAAALDAEVACSRPMAEGVGWYTHDRYVGVTGQHVQPDLYLALGISGQLQHTVGARASGTIVAINSDKNCPYFKEADYCVVADLYEIVPALMEALK